MKRYDPNLSLLLDYLWFVLYKQIILTIYGMIQSLQRGILWFTDLSISISLLFLHEKFMLMLIYILCLQLLNFVSTKPVEAISHAYSELCLCTICLYGVYTGYQTYPRLIQRPVQFVGEVMISFPDPMLQSDSLALVPGKVKKISLLVTRRAQYYRGLTFSCNNADVPSRRLKC